MSFNFSIKYFLQGVCVLLAGTLIYVFWRSTSIIANHFIALLFSSKYFSLQKPFAIPEFVVFSFPSALWVIAWMLIMKSIWGEDINSQPLFWLSSVPILGVTSEIGQYFNIVPGTWDIFDLAAYLFAFFGAYFLLFTKNGPTHKD